MPLYRQNFSVQVLLLPNLNTQSAALFSQSNLVNGVRTESGKDSNSKGKGKVKKVRTQREKRIEEATVFTNRTHFKFPVIIHPQNIIKVTFLFCLRNEYVIWKNSSKHMSMFLMYVTIWCVLLYKINLQLIKVFLEVFFSWAKSVSCEYYSRETLSRLPRQWKKVLPC